MNLPRRSIFASTEIFIGGFIGTSPSPCHYVLDGRHAAVWWPDNIQERLEITTELMRVATEAGDRERTLQAHHYRFIALLELGDTAGAAAEIEAQARLAEELRQPAQRFYVATCRALVAAFEGRLEEAEQLTAEAFRYGERAERSMAVIYQRFQLYAVRWLQGRLDELEDTIRRSVIEFPSYVVCRCVLAHIYVQLDREGDAREAFESLAVSGFAELPRNDEWVFGTALLADVAGFLRDRPRADTLYHFLLPYHARNAVSAPDVCIGTVARSLGVLAETLGRLDDAARHFEDALAMNARTGGRPWVAQTQIDYASMLVEHGELGGRARALELISACLKTARELDAQGLVMKASALERALRVPTDSVAQATDEVRPVHGTSKHG
jgi:tetratricopeptide (TPR) repeat protein